MNKACECEFKDQRQRKIAQRQILEDPDLKLPKEAVDNAVRKEVQDNWAMKCSCEDRSKIISAVHYEHNDWYLCTLKNMITRPEHRGQGFGGLISDELMEKMRKDTQCIILAGDIDINNPQSLGIWEGRHGFKRVSRFCWSEDKPPVDVLHLVRFPPDENANCLSI